MSNVADIQLGATDGLGGKVELIYGRNAPNYAVFRSRTRVLVQFADAPDKAAEQRRALAPLNPLRGEINGLVEDWRVDTRGAKRENSWRASPRKADCFDRRVGDALVVAFEGDVDGARTLLEEIKADVLADRTAFARLQYVVAAAAAVIVAAIIAALMHADVAFLTYLGVNGDQGRALLEAAGAGGLGAFFSIALGIRGRTVLPDLQLLANSMDAVLRVIIGVIAATILIAMLIADVVEMSIGTKDITTGSWLVIFIVGFLAGFSERLVPDLLSKVATKFDVASASESKTVIKTNTTVVAPAAAGGVAAAAPPEGPDEDPLPEEAAHDSCACDVELTDDEITSDEQLPPASGGVAAAGGAG